MAFVNEMVPNADKKEFHIPDYKTVTPSFWTIDRDKKIILFDYWTNIDKPSEILFALVCDDIVIRVTLGQLLYTEENKCRWNLLNIKIPDDCKRSKEQILNILREAIKAYGVSGYTFPVPNAIPKKPCEIIIGF